MANENAQKIAALLHEAGEVHHVYYADVDGNDDDWATFYSEWLLARTAFPTLLARRPVRSGLTRDLVAFDEEHQASGASEPWPAVYAAKLIAKYG
ncbi:MAG TPA: hypothetical protein VGU66_13230 [Candidatus Elarobacter sp.]|nr:hypothetical protein [Candidatus Elarobacter sp.]